MRDSSSTPPLVLLGEQHIQWSTSSSGGRVSGDGGTSSSVTVDGSGDAVDYASNGARSSASNVDSNGAPSHDTDYSSSTSSDGASDRVTTTSITALHYALNCSWSPDPRHRMSVILSATNTWPAGGEVLVRVRGERKC